MPDRQRDNDAADAFAYLSGQRTALGADYVRPYANLSQASQQIVEGSYNVRREAIEAAQTTQEQDARMMVLLQARLAEAERTVLGTTGMGLDFFSPRGRRRGPEVFDDCEPEDL